MTFTERLTGEPTTCSQVRDLEQRVRELSECLMRRDAAQDEINARQQAQIDSLREQLRTRELQLREFAEALASASGFVQGRADRLLDLLR